MPQTVGMKLALEGEAQYKAGLQQIQQKSKELAAEMKAVVSAGEGEEKQMEVLGKQISNQKNLIDQLTTKYDKQQSEIENTKKAIEDAKKAYGENSTEVQKLETQLTKQETALSKTKTQINNETDSLNKMEKAEEAAAKGADDLGEETEEAGEQAKKAGNDGFTVFKGIVANLAADAIKMAVDGLKNLASSIKEAVSETAEYGDEIDKASQKLGISAESYQELSYAMERSGADISAFQKGMLNMNDALAEVANGNEDAGDAYKKLGVSMRRANGQVKNSEELLMDTIDALAGMEDETQRDAAAQDIFGKKMTELRPLLNSGADGVRELMQEAKDYGMVMSDEAVASSASYQDSLSRLTWTIRGVKTSMVSEFLPAITQVMDGFSKMIAGVDGGNETLSEGVKNIVSSIKEKVPEFLSVGAEILKSMITGLTDNLPSFVSAITDVIPNVFDSIASVIDSIDIGELVRTVFNCANSIVKSILPRIPELLIQIVAGVVEAIPDIFAGVGETIYNVFNVLFGGYSRFDEFKDKIDAQSKAWGEVKSSMEGAADQINNDALTWSNAWDMLKDMTDSAGNVKEGFEGIASVLVDQLNDALGLNIEIIDGQIQDYQELCNSIDLLIEKKRAELILQAEEEAYTEALRIRPDLIDAVTDAETNLQAAQEELTEAQREYDGLVESGGDLTMATQRIDRARVAVVNMQDALDEATVNLEENTALQTKYMDDYTAVMQGDYNSIGRTSKKYTGSTVQDLVTYRKNVEKQLQQDKRNYDSWVKDYQASNSAHAQAQVAYYQKRISEDQTQIAKINGIIKQGGKDFTQGYVNGILEKEAEASRAGEQITNNAVKAVQSTQQSQSPAKVTKGLGNDFGEGYKLGIQEKGSTVENSAKEVAGKAVNGIKSTASEAKTAGESVGSNFADGISSKKDGAYSSGETVAQKAKSGLSSQDTYTPGTSAASSFSSGIKDKKDDAYSAGEKVAKKAKSGLNSEYDNIYNAGWNTSAGFAAGIGDAGYLVTNAAYATAYAAKKKMEATLEIASPSKVMRRLGRWIPAGLALGIEDETDLVTDAMDSMAVGIAEDFSLGGVSYRSAASAIGSRAAAGSSTTNTNNVTMNIYGAEGQDINELAEIIDERLQMTFDRRNAVYA